MSILKIKQGGQWNKIYGGEFSKKMKKSSNLANLTDVSAARTNIGLTGDVSTHAHDSLYLPEINKEGALRQWEDGVISAKIDEVRKHANETMTLAEKNAINAKIASLQTRLENLRAARSAADLKIYSDYNALIEQAKTRALQVAQMNIATTGTTTSANREISSWNYKTQEPTGSTSTISYYKKVSVEPGVAGGTYSLASILEKLMKLSHEHTVKDQTVTTNCRCDCNDTRCCGGGGH